MKSANILRGAFGLAFRNLYCRPDCPGAAACSRRAVCPYACLFEPRGDGDSGGVHPSGLADPPRPFVFRAWHLDGRRLPAGSAFHFDFHLFERDPETFPRVLRAFESLAAEGFGPGNAKAAIVEVEQRELRFDLAPHAVSPSAVVLRFASPTELKDEGRLVEVPAFAVLFRRVLTRIANLRQMYQGPPLAVDYSQLIRRAAAIRLRRHDLTTRYTERFSTRTKQTHPLGGFLGEAEYAGPELGQFLPFLQAAAFTGVGRQTVWGKGVLEVVRVVS